VAVAGALAAVLGVAAAACGDDEEAASCRDLTPLDGFGEVEVAVDGDERCLLLAQTPEERARGLMEVTDLEGYPGMIFVYPEDVGGGFWMRNTPMPLSIAYLAADGGIVSTADMEPCEESVTCPSYPPDGEFRFAVEVPRGELDDLGLTGDATLEVVGETDPS